MHLDASPRGLVNGVEWGCSYQLSPRFGELFTNNSKRAWWGGSAVCQLRRGGSNGK